VSGIDQPVGEVVRRYAEAGDPAARAACWDRGFDAPVLVPAGAGEPLVGWPAIETWWEDPASRADVRIAALRIMPIAPGLAEAACRMRRRSVLPGGEAVAEDVWLIAILRERDGAWRIVCAHEAAPDPAWLVCEAMAPV
jgi:hypothetical protein